ncbi:PA3715 family protein [Pseudoduganella sp. HUAS MS19]
MNLKRAACTAVLAIIALPALAESQACSEQQLELAAAFLKEGGKRKASESEWAAIDSACKPWPGKEPYTIGAFVYDDENQHGKWLLVALLDRSRERVVASYWTPAGEDAIMRYVDGMRIDTARYQLQPGLRAFGLDFNTHSPRYAEGGYGPMRTLYVREGSAIRPVLSDMPVSRWSYLGEMQWAAGNDEEPAPEPDIERFEYTISIAATRSKGFADLLITRKSSQQDVKPTIQLLRYDGKRYPLPQE